MPCWSYDETKTHCTNLGDSESDMYIPVKQSMSPAEHFYLVRHNTAISISHLTTLEHNKE